MTLNNFDTDRVIHSLKTALACLIGLVITRTVNLNINQWIIITIIVVMCAQLSVGSVMQKSYMRFFGTVCGSILAIITLLFFGSDIVAITIALVIAAIVFSYLATGKSKINEAGTLGAATTAIILMGPNPTLLLGLERFVEISVGILIAALVSQFVFPISARQSLRLSQATNIRKLREFYEITLSVNPTEKEIKRYQELDDEIVKSLTEQRKLATDAAKEIFGKKFNLKYFQTLLRCEVEILRSISFMHYAYEEAPERKKIFSEIYTLKEFHDAVSNTLLNIADSIEQRKPMASVSLPTIDLLKKSVNSNLKEYSADSYEYAHAYLFCAEILIAHLNKITQLIAEIRK